MAVGYTRQSAADIVTGETVEAAPLNTEFNQVQSAMHAATGHNHDGTAGGGAAVSLSGGVTGTLGLARGGTNGDLSGATAGSTLRMNTAGTAVTYQKNNTTATSNPTVNDDTGDGYIVGSLWFHTGTVFIATDVTLGAAVWADGTSAAAVVTALTTATVTALGRIELATTAEILTGTDVDRAVTPAGLKAKIDAIATGTISAVGLLELATTAEILTGTDTERAVTPAGLKAKVDAIVTGTVSAVGLLELATTAEVITGTDTERAITPAGLNGRTAGPASPGLVELATSAELLTGTDESRAVTPGGLALYIRGLQALAGKRTNVSANTSLVANTRYRATSGTITCHLDALAADEFIIVERDFSAGNLYLVRGTNTIDGASADFQMDIDKDIVEFYCNSAGAIVTKLIGVVP